MMYLLWVFLVILIHPSLMNKEPHFFLITFSSFFLTSTFCPLTQREIIDQAWPFVNPSQGILGKKKLENWRWGIEFYDTCEPFQGKLLVPTLSLYKFTLIKEAQTPDDVKSFY